MDPKQLCAQLEQQRLENVRRRAEAEAAEAKQKADEEERETWEKVDKDRVLWDIAALVSAGSKLENGQMTIYKYISRLPFC